MCVWGGGGGGGRWIHAYICVCMFTCLCAYICVCVTWDDVMSDLNFSLCTCITLCANCCIVNLCHPIVTEAASDVQCYRKVRKNESK